MDREVERKMAAQAGAMLSGTNADKQAEAPRNYGYEQAASPLRRAPIRERAYRALHEAQRANQRAESAQRALSIIEQHPEFAELLDALEQF